MTAVCWSFWVWATGADWSGRQLGGARGAVDCVRASEEPLAEEPRGMGGGEWMMISLALYRSVPVREGKGRSGTGRYYVVLGGTKWYQAVRRRRGSVEVLKR